MDESPNKEKPRTFTAQFYQTFKEWQTPMLLKLPQNTRVSNISKVIL
jgi:hypothetical protein